MLLATYDVWAFVSENRQELFEGFLNTLKVSAFAIAGSFVIGIVLGAARAHRIPVVTQLAATYVEVVRNTPILAQIFLFFYGLPLLSAHLRFTSYTTAWVAVTIWGGAFNTENFRAGFEAVPFRYREGAYALGFDPLRAFANVTLPIGGRIALPSSINTYVSILKNTAILGPAISFPELTYQAYSLDSTYFKALETYLMLAVVYLVIVWTLSLAIRAVESRLALPERA
jgi:His/Glu/Gln/Arg/opine family amino acid ABC transporter permease subunit